ncbi:hypothetical protein [Morganella morganii]|uniref:hypothetical protein n=1 Tax=Morganella morganii TaxID=582 RepID=UPI000DE606F6|nr:Uncharacterised protein [Klebsiella pneumoniae]
MNRKSFSLVKIFGSVPVHPEVFGQLDKKLKWLGVCEEGNSFCVSCGTTTPSVPRSHHPECLSYCDMDSYPEYENEIGVCPGCGSEDGLSINSNCDLGISEISCCDCHFIFQKEMSEEDLMSLFNKRYKQRLAK